MGQMTGTETKTGFASLTQAVRKLRHQKLGNLYGYAFIAPLVIVWAIFGGYPYVRGILMTLQDYRSYVPETWPISNSFVGLRNFGALLQDSRVWEGVRASFFMFITVFPATFIFSLFTAVMLNRVSKGWLASLYRVIITLSWVTPAAAAMPMWRQLYEPNIGYVTTLVRDVLGVWPDPPAWLSSRFWFWPAIGLAITWKSAGYNMLLFLIGLYNIPGDLYDAARMDGANAWQQFVHVELPGIRNIMVLYLVTNIGWVGGSVIEVMNFGQGPQEIGKTLGVYAWETAFMGVGKLGYASAINFFAGLCNLVLATLVFRLLPSEKA